MATIPDLFSGYIAGREQAIKSNWNDLNSYNNVLGGQIDNAFKMQTFDPAARQVWNHAQQSDYSTIAQAQGLDNTLQSNKLAQSAGIPQMATNAQVAQIQANIDALTKQKEALDFQIQQLRQQLQNNNTQPQQTAQATQPAQTAQANGGMQPLTPAGSTAPAMQPLTTK
jgi:hypothetical protein